MTLQNYKEAGDWQSLFGINLRCPHLSWYTMKGQAKRDYPASIMHQSGWYKEFEAVEDYFSRLQLMLMQGQSECEVLVINPVESVWCRIHPGWSKAFTPQDKDIINLENAHADLFHWLAGEGIDFDYGDEDMIARMGSAEEKALKIGEAKYTTVIVPPLTTIRSTTLELLKKFAAAGGKVIFAGAAPGYVDALPSENALNLAENCEQCDFKRKPLASLVKNSIANIVEIDTGSECSDIFCQVRRSGSELIIVAMNVSTTESYEDVAIRIKTKGFPQIWDCRSGDITAAEFETNGDFLEITADFDPAREMVIVVSDKQSDSGVSQEKLCCEEIKETKLTEAFDYSLNEPNVCVLDFARYKIADGDWQNELEVLKIDRKLREHMGLDKRSGQMVQPWCRGEGGKKEHIALEFSFGIESMPSDDTVMAIEEPEKFDIYINDRKLEIEKLPEFWVDICFSKVKIPTDRLKPGINKIRLETDYDNNRDLEAIYLLGDFGVKLNGIEKTITALPEKLAGGDITPQGLPFYSGKIRYEIAPDTSAKLTAESCISLPEIGAACAKIIDGKGNEKPMVFKPYSTSLDRLDIASGLSIELILGRRNTFGPLHLDRPEETNSIGFRKWYGPDEFESSGKLWSDNYMLIEQGLLKAPVIYG
jgi:hypothetical protein